MLIFTRHRLRNGIFVALLFTLAAIALIASPILAPSAGRKAAGTTATIPSEPELISRADAGQASATAGALISTKYSYSADGRYVVFESTSQNLVPGQDDNRGFNDIFLHDRVAGTTVLVSHVAGAPLTGANESSLVPAISADGRWVAYWSFATNLATGQNDTNISSPDVFLYDRLSGTNTLVSHLPGQPATTGDSNSFDPSISSDGRYVFFASSASNLVAGQVDGGGGGSIFVYDRLADSIALVSHASGAAATTSNGFSFGAAPSADGAYVAYLSNASNLVAGQTEDARRYDIFLWSRATGESVLVSHADGSPTTAANGTSSDPAISADGNFVTYYGAATNLVSAQADGNQMSDVFVYDRVAGTNTLVSHTSASATTTGNASALYSAISADGALVVYQSTSANLVGQDLNNNEDIFLWDRATNTNTLISKSNASMISASANGRSFGGRPSRDGKTIVFSSYATDLVPGQNSSSSGDVFLYDRTAGTLRLMSHIPGSSSAGGDGQSFIPLLSDDGSWIVYNSQAGDLVAQDTNGSGDVFIYDRANDSSVAASASSAGASSVTPNGHSGRPRASADGRYVVFTSEGTNLIPGQSDGNNAADIFLRDRGTGQTTLVTHAAGSPLTAANGASDAPVISADGRWIAYPSRATDLIANGTDLNSGADIFLYDRTTNTSSLVSHSTVSTVISATDGSETPGISADGHYVVYTSNALDLVAGQSDGNVATDVFLYDRETGLNQIVSHADGAPAATGTDYSFAPSISPDGNFISYYSAALDLVANQDNDLNSLQHLFLYDRTTARNELIDHESGAPLRTSDGNTGSTVNDDPAVFSADNHFLAFVSTSTNLIAGQTDANGRDDVFLYDRVAKTTLLASHAASSNVTSGDSYAYSPSVSADGGLVAYRSASSDLVTGQVDTNTFQDVFVYDRAAGTNTLVSHAVSAPLTAGDGPSGDAPRTGSPAISPDGSLIAFSSSASNLIGGQTDLNGINSDVFLYDRSSGTSVLLSHALNDPTTTGNDASGDSQHSGGPNWSANNTLLVFASRAGSLIAGDFNQREDIYAYDLTTTPTPSPTPSPTATSTPTPTPTPSPSPSPSPSSTPAPNPSPTPTATITPTPTPTTTPTPTASPTPAASPTSTPTPSPTASPSPAQLMNISTRVPVRTGDQAGIGGFILRGNTPKRVVIRAIGPSLKVNDAPLAARLQDPKLELRAADGSLLAANDNWRSSQEAEIISTGLAPTDDRESAIVRVLAPGNYTAIVRGVADTNGIGVVEIYDIESASNSELANISTRGFVDTGDNVLIGGFILRGNSAQKLLLRAIGPELTGSGVPDALQDTVMELHDENGNLLVVNDDWKETQQSEIEATGIPPHDDRESAILRTLVSGNYTSLIRGKGGSTGVALVEAYNLGSP